MLISRLAISHSPELPPTKGKPRLAQKTALLILPFYVKSRHGSPGKHVLTPALTLSALAAATPGDWQIAIWDENLLQGPPPQDPVPEVVGITVHLTFARRAYELAAWYRERGARVILGGLHLQSCPEEAAQHADAISLGNGVDSWPLILRDVAAGRLAPCYNGSYQIPFDCEPLPRRDLVDRASYLTVASIIATRGCRNRCGFCYVSTSSVRPRYEMRDAAAVAREFASIEEPYGVLPAALFNPIHLETPTSGCRIHAGLSGRKHSLQEGELALAGADTGAIHARRVAPAHRPLKSASKIKKHATDSTDFTETIIAKIGEIRGIRGCFCSF